MREVRERYNAKARQSSAGSRKTGKRRQDTVTASAEPADPNADIIVPKSNEQKEKERKVRLVQEVSHEYPVSRFR
jgi:ATP-dependent RNA helicase DHX37/DHR1